MPTNAARFAQYLSSTLDSTQLHSLRYAAFGLGSTSYRQFNQAVKSVDGRLKGLGALRIGSLGLGDDGAGTLEDDYLLWSADVLNRIAADFNLERINGKREAMLRVTEYPRASHAAVLDGEPNRAHLYGRVKGPFTSTNPYPAPIKRFYELTSPKSQRKCMHIEFDTSMSTLTYVTGDHLAITPVNSDCETQRFLQVFGLAHKADTVIETTSLDPATTNPFPARTTYHAAVSKYLDICGPVSRQTLLVLADQSEDTQPREKLRRLATSVDLFMTVVKARHLNLAQTLELTLPVGSQQSIDFALLIELVGVLKPRYYSISSSNMTSKKTISVTVMEEKSNEEGWPYSFHGVSTSYLSDVLHTPLGGSSRTRGPQGAFDKPMAYIHVRKSTFRLPRRSECPIIMIGPGTGVAPFRAFMHERAFDSRSGKRVGKTILFYGCRKEDEDFLYCDEMTDVANSFEKDTFQIHTAYSRTPGIPKTYVQHKLAEQSSQIRDLILHQSAHVYICGNARRMARDVNAAMLKLLAADPSFEGSPESVVADFVGEMKREKRWQEDVW